jgi:hypothetical protein
LGILRVLTIGFGAGADVRGSQGRPDYPRAICAADQSADYKRKSIVRQLGRNGLALTALLAAAVPGTAQMRARRK